MGDDFDNFPGVKHDVSMFAQMKGLELHLLGPVSKGQWYFIKPLD